jgi:hypothetical protein
MNKVRTIGILFVLALAFVAMTLPSQAALVATQFGFPTIVQNGATTAFNRDTAVASDIEAVAITFPTADCGIGTGLPGLTGITSGGFALAFPTIAQTAVQNQCLTHTDFATTVENAAFAYPFAGVGGVAVPGFGFGF